MSQKSIQQVLASYKDRHCLHELAQRTKIKYSSLARILNEEDAYDLGVSKIISFIEATNYDFTLLDHIEARLGRLASFSRENKILKSFEISNISDLLAVSNEAINELLKSVADGKVDKKESKACINDLVSLIQVANALIVKLRSIENSLKLV